jgi:hypothetical protein
MNAAKSSRKTKTAPSKSAVKTKAEIRRGARSEAQRLLRKTRKLSMNKIAATIVVGAAFIAGPAVAMPAGGPASLPLTSNV